MRNLGCFVSSAGGIYKGIENAEQIGVNTMMIYPAAPQRWNSQPFKEEEIIKFNERREINLKSDKKINKVYFHGIYLINLATPNSQQFHLSKLSLVNHLSLCEKINADGVIFHTGSFKDCPDENVGIERIIYGLNWIFENVEVKGKKLFLECAAGAGGKVVGHKFEQLASIYDKLDKEIKAKVGFCLDTQHLFGSGYDLINNLEEVVASADKLLGLENIPVIHFNDSKVDLGSNVDRHENIGEGKIGSDAMMKFLNHPKLKSKDFVLETPALKDIESSKLEVEKLKSWVK